MSTALRTLRLAHELTGDARYKRAALRVGVFLLVAQMPDPQPGWAQQYDRYMPPAWARRFEPAAISGGGSQAVMTTLMDLYERSLLASGNSQGSMNSAATSLSISPSLTGSSYSDADIPTHYAFTVKSRLPAIRERCEHLLESPWPIPVSAQKKCQVKAKTLTTILDSLDARGAWVEDGRLQYWGSEDATRRVIHSRTFANSIRLLAAYAAD